jgi:hypothetical protein
MGLDEIVALPFLIGAKIIGWLASNPKKEIELTQQKREQIQKQREQFRKQRVKDHQLYLDERMQKLSLSCIKCNSLAKPILDTTNRYKCDHCGTQFAGDKHRLFSHYNAPEI